MIVSGDDEIGLRRRSAFEDTVVRGVRLYDSDVLCGFNRLREIPDAILRQFDGFLRPPEFITEHMRYLVHDVIGDREFYLTGALQIEQLVRQSAEVQSGDVDVRIRSDTDHLLTALLTGFQNEPGYVGLGEP